MLPKLKHWVLIPKPWITDVPFPTEDTPVFRCQKGRKEMKSNTHVYIALSVAFFIGLLGCGEIDETPESVQVAEVPPNEVTGYGQTSETFKAREVASREPMNRYLQLRETDPEAAFEALKESFNILHDNHPKTEAYAKLFFEMHTAGVATLPQELALSEIFLEIALDNHYGQEVIKQTKTWIQEIKQRIKELKRQGIDPDEFTEPFIFDPML